MVNIGPCPPGDHYGVEGIQVDLVHTLGVLNELHKVRVVLIAAADHILGLPLRGVFGVAHGVCDAGSACGAEDLDLVTEFGEPEIRVAELRPPEAHGPVGGRRDGRVRDDDRDSLGVLRADWVEVLVAHNDVLS
jgi:hypothetical protein